ncbi:MULTISPECIES: hypothetical protein [unclassified Moraxella]|uniref:hypothetical protein n=1 Tax=unclassified Moraxella TaxID=2685852 RepID=UPI003AF790BE
MKKLSILAITATVAITPAFADVTSNYNTPVSTIQQADLSFAFDNAENLQAMAMTDKQMADTEGAWANFAVGAGIGAVGGHFSYMSSAIASNSYNWKAHGAAVAVGAGSGLLNPVSKATHLVNGMRGVAVATVGAGAVGYAGR